MVVASLLASLVALLAAAPAPAPAAEKALWGPTALPDGSSPFALYQQLGIDTLQLSMSWADVASARPAAPEDPADPAYRWPAEIDVAATEAARRGIRLSLLVAQTPPWANGNRSPLWRPDRAQDFADFLTAAARRYPTVRRWMIWGEPNRHDRFQPNARNSPIGPRAYAVLLDAAYAGLKRASRHNIVIGANTWTSGTVKPANFLRLMRLPSGRPPRLDWLGHNPFPFRFPKLAQQPLAGGYRDISDIDTISRDALRVYGRRIPLWLSEYTIGSAPMDSFPFSTTPAGQARWLSAAYELAQDAKYVETLGWFSLLDGPATQEGGSTLGLMTFEGARKPAFSAYRDVP